MSQKDRKKYTFKDRIGILRPCETRDEFGGVAVKFVTVYEIWATVNMQQTKPIDLPTYQATSHLKIVCKNLFDRQVFEADKIEWRGRIYRIASMSTDYDYCHITCYEAKD
jgi:SPP1 family predicted phage head-tail adaptor